MVRRMDRYGEVLIWCRKCSGYARQRMGPKLMKCCKPEQVGTKEHGNMLKRIQKKAASLPRKQEIDRLKDRKEGSQGKNTEKGLWKVARENMLQDRGALPEEEGDFVRQCKATLEEKFLSIWREDVEDKVERRRKVNRETREKVSRRGKREEEKGEDETVAVERRCVNPFSVILWRNSVSGRIRIVVGNSWSASSRLCGESKKCVMSEHQ